VRMGVEQGERLRRLLDELLDLSRLDAVAVAVNPKPVVVRSVLEEIASAAVPPGTSVTIEASRDLAAVIDPHVLDRVVSNLLSNAVTYGAPPVVVTAERRGTHLRIAVSDGGSGVPEKLRPRLFERFARGDEANGTGLGLAIARSYARAHGGDIVYEPDNGGARFVLIVPQG